jgi:hypothetical protein
MNYFLMTASKKTWEACCSEIMSLLDEIDAPSPEIHGTERLLQILYGHGGNKHAVQWALRSLSPRLLLKLDAAERSAFCGNK